MTRSVSDQIIDLARQNVPPREIRAQLPLPKPSIYVVYEILREARERDASIPRFNSAGLRRTQTPVFIPNADFAVLGAAAAKRQISPAELARRLLTTIVRDDLVDGVLDDAGDR